jgi:Rrf2 family nitric oxide-sensitive transcriptional repressor
VISQTVEYALRAIVTIANHRGKPCTAQKISEITQVPAPYLSKLMQGLVRSGVVKSQRGLHGGFVLTKDAGELTIWEIVDAVEPMKRIEECPLGITSHGSELCPLHRRLADAIEVVEKMFRETTIEDVISAPGRPTPLCDDRPVIQIEPKPAKPKKKTKKK